MNIPLYASNNITREAAVNAVDAVMQRRKRYGSDGCRRLESEITSALDVSFAKAVNSAEAALRSLLYAWSVGRGEAVFVPSFAEPYVLITVMECGAVPVMVDCDRDTWSISPEKLESAVKKCIKHNELYPRAVIACDTFGVPFDWKKINDICMRYGLLLIEDASCALGAARDGKNAGTLGEGSVISFKYPLSLSAWGSGGAALTDDPQLAKNVRFVAEGAWKLFSNTTGAGETVRKGAQASMDEFTAELLAMGMKDAMAAAEKRRSRAKQLRAAAEGTAVMIQKEPDGVRGAYPVFALRAADKENAQRMICAFREEGIECNAVYSKPLCRHGAFKELGVNTSDMPVGSELSVCVFVLPCHEELTDEQTEYICGAIKKICI